MASEYGVEDVTLTSNDPILVVGEDGCLVLLPLCAVIIVKCLYFTDPKEQFLQSLSQNKKNNVRNFYSLYQFLINLDAGVRSDEQNYLALTDLGERSKLERMGPTPSLRNAGWQLTTRHGPPVLLYQPSLYVWHKTLGNSQANAEQ